MATHDYVIANGTGAAVRSDLNNALAAIVSNNSSSTEPGTRYAYQFWADTNANVLKIRNSANDGWITLRQLDGTMLIEDGSATEPGLAFADDLNTGIYSGANNQIGFTTDGVERFKIQTAEAVFNDESNDFDFRVESNGNTHMLFVDAGNDAIGIGTDTITNPYSQSNFTNVNIDGTWGGIISFKLGGEEQGWIGQRSSGNQEMVLGASSNKKLLFATDGNNERARIDSSGRILINHSSSRSVGAARIVQIEGTSDATAGISILRNTNNSSSPTINLGKSRGTTTGSTTIVQDGDGLGSIYFRAADGTDINSIAASIDVGIDGTPGSNDTPGRIMFGTTSDGASSPTERVRIDSSGNVAIGPNTQGHGLLTLSKSASSAFNALVIQQGNTGSTATDGLHIGIDSGVDAYITHKEIRGLAFGTANTERARIDSSGRMLIGVSSAINTDSSSLLQVVGTSGGGINLAVNDTSVVSNQEIGIIRFFSNDTLTAGGYEECARIRVQAAADHTDASKASYMGFWTTGSGNDTTTERMRINHHGGLNVGASKLGVNTGEGNITVDEGVYISAYNGDYQIRGNSSGSGSATLYIGNAAIQTSSDRRLKENIVDTVVDAAEELKRVRVVDFTWNDPSDMSFNNRNARGTWTGLIAQELIDVFPFAVNAPRVEEDLSIDQDSEKRWLVDQDQLVPVLIKGFQQALARIETLEAKVAALEAG